MDSGKPTGVRSDDKGPLNITLWGSGDNDEPNRTCDDSNMSNGVACNDLHFSGSCQGEIDNEPLGSATNDQLEGSTSHTVYPGDSEDTCQQIMTNTRYGSSGQTISGAAVEGSNGDGDDRGATEMKMGNNKKKKKRAVRATLYTTHYDGMLYDVPIHSSLGEAYRKLVTRDERREFMIQNGVARPYKSHYGYEPAPLPKGKGDLAGHEGGLVINEVS